MELQAIKDVREREQLFNEHMKERERKEKEARKAELKKKKAAFLAFLEANRSIKVILLSPLSSSKGMAGHASDAAIFLGGRRKDGCVTCLGPPCFAVGINRKPERKVGNGKHRLIG